MSENPLLLRLLCVAGVNALRIRKITVIEFRNTCYDHTGILGTSSHLVSNSPASQHVSIADAIRLSRENEWKDREVSSW